MPTKSGLLRLGSAFTKVFGKLWIVAGVMSIFVTIILTSGPYWTKILVRIALATHGVKMPAVAGSNGGTSKWRGSGTTSSVRR